MTRRRLPLMLAAVGVLIIIAALVAAAVVRSSDRATLALGERMDVPVVVTEPGVLDAVGPEVTVRATADDDEPVVLAIARTSEVEAWLGDNDHARVTGLSSWEELTVEVVTGGGQAATEAPTDSETAAPTDEETAALADGAESEAAFPDPAGSDLWVVETASTGTAELSWTDTPGRWSLVAATDGAGPAPDLELEWGRQVSTPWLVPAIVIGAVALIAGVTMLVLDLLARREQRRRDDARARREAGGGAPALSITDTDPGTGERLTRRQIREMEREMARAERNLHADQEAGLPPVPLASEQVGADDDAGAATPGTDEPPLGAEGSESAPGTGDLPAVTQEPDVERDRAAQGSTLEGEPVDAPVDDQPGTEEPDAGHEPDEEGAAGERVPGTEGSTVERDPAAAVVRSADDTPLAEDDADLPPEDEDGYTPAPPSWRSVWGFGGAPPGHDVAQDLAGEPSDQTDEHDDREERR